MASRIIIDGYNLACAMTGTPLSSVDIEQLREDLISTLCAYKRIKGVKITLVFDGTKSGKLHRGKEIHGGIDVLYTREGETADNYIKKMVAEKGAGLTIVSSDGDICSFSEKNGAVCISSEEFRSAIETAKYYELKGSTPEDENYDKGKPQKGPSKRPSKKERAKLRILKKL